MVQVNISDASNDRLAAVSTVTFMVVPIDPSVPTLDPANQPDVTNFLTEHN